MFVITTFGVCLCVDCTVAIIQDEQLESDV